MKLTEEDFSHAVASLGGTEIRSSSDARGRVRIPKGSRATIIPCNDTMRGELASVVVVNLSDSGIGVINSVPINVGARFIFRTSATPSHRPIAILCTAIYCQTQPQGMFAIGARFVGLVSIPNESAGEQFMPPDHDDLESHDTAHLREVEDRLSRLSL